VSRLGKKNALRNPFDGRPKEEKGRKKLRKEKRRKGICTGANQEMFSRLFIDPYGRGFKSPQGRGEQTFRGGEASGFPLFGGGGKDICKANIRDGRSSCEDWRENMEKRKNKTIWA